MATQSDIRALVESQAGRLRQLSQRIYTHPELGMEETRACAWQVQLLKQWGFNVRSPYLQLPTAFKATAGSGKPVFCVMSEYDALPESGHACGHNLIAAAALGAGRALQQVLKKEKIKGTLVVMGTPAEEAKGGKVIMVRRGALKGIDAALMAHPSFRTIADNGCSAVSRYRVEFRGHAAHAAASPEKGKNALDAVMLLFHGVNAWRQQLRESARIHGIVSDGGAAPNIIPETAACEFYLRAMSNDYLAGMTKRFEKMVRGAALMTDTKAVLIPDPVPYMARRPNKPINEAFLDAAEEAGLKPNRKNDPGRASTDFGDVSQQIPGSHVYFGISKKRIAGHSPEFLEASGSEYGAQQMLKTAECLAWVGYRYFSDAEFREAVRKDFAEEK